MINIDLSDKKALVTDATSDIGKAISLKLAQAGCNLAIHHIADKSNARKLKKVIEGSIGREAFLFSADISSEAKVKKMVCGVIDLLGSIDILINHHCIKGGPPDIRNTDLKELDEAIDTNLTGAFYCAKHCSKVMGKGRYGKIINVYPTSFLTGLEGLKHSAVSGGMDAMVRALSRELTVHNIRINGIAFAGTENAKQQAKDVNDKVPESSTGATEDIAKICVFLCSGLADHINGQTIIADGYETFTDV